ncbi:hypothetical protein [Bradyrhizobium sp. URHD0069]|uniref:hypothetical protein n=1 Tax=Bradyrhizobium sp. URHD0069 TaxID=1380355 RepID=UPI0018CC3A26|nr:hypothetical protein [Bradyrhizobium sp. URHD0069]
MSKPPGPRLTHAAEAGFPLPPIINAASELDDNNERIRAQGIIKNHLSRSEQAQSQDAITLIVPMANQHVSTPG